MFRGMDLLQLGLGLALSLQQGGADRDDFAALVADVRRAHHTEAGRRPTSFAGTIGVTSIAPDADSIAVQLEIRFRLPDRIRYCVDEGGRRLERGRDANGGWVWLGAEYEPQSLGKAEYEGDREELKRHIAIAAQLLRLLDPAAVVESLAGNSADEPVLDRETFELGRDQAIACRTIAGTVAGMPMYLAGGDSGRAHLKLWIDAASHRLIAVRTMPLNEHGRIGPAGELVVMPEHADRDGVLLPVLLHFAKVTPGEPNQPLVQVRLRQLELDPALPDERFDRGTPW